MSQKKKPARSAAVKKARQRQAASAGKKLGAQVLTESVLEEVNEVLAAFASDVNIRLKVVASTLNQLGQNQEAFKQSQAATEDQFWVLCRLLIGRVNQLTRLENRIAQLAFDHEGE